MVRRMTTKATSELTSEEAASIRTLLDGAFDGRFTDSLWNQALGGIHFFVVEDGLPISHAAVVGRTLVVGERDVETGYVEAVGTGESFRRQGLARKVMSFAAGHISESYEMGALHSVLPTFYVHLGWEKWRGPTYVRSETGLTRTPEDDGYIHVWRLPASSDLDLDDPISCPWRPGYVW